MWKHVERTKIKFAFHYMIQITKDKEKIPLKASPFLLLYLVNKVHSVTKVSPVFGTDIQSEISLPHNLQASYMFSVNWNCFQY